jgi:hypothetical protein
MNFVYFYISSSVGSLSRRPPSTESMKNHYFIFAFEISIRVVKSYYLRVWNVKHPSGVTLRTRAFR